MPKKKIVQKNKMKAWKNTITSDYRYCRRKKMIENWTTFLSKLFIIIYGNFRKFVFYMQSVFFVQLIQVNKKM